MNFIKNIVGINPIPIQTNENTSPKRKTKKQKVQENLLCCVRFNLYETGDINVNCEWNPNCIDENYASIFGEFIHHICAGTMKPNMTHVLGQMMSKHIELRPFIKNVLKQIQTLEDITDTIPVIHPLSVFNMTQPLQEQEE